jgi:hypothetical protein
MGINDLSLRVDGRKSYKFDIRPKMPNCDRNTPSISDAISIEVFRLTADEIK